MSEPLDWLAQTSGQNRDRIAGALNKEERAEFAYHWQFFAREAQLPPPGDWRTWLIMAGRGFGKTRAGSEWVRMVAEENPDARIALVSSSMAEARAVMVDGESGIISCCPPDRAPKFESSLRRLKFPNGAQAQIFSASEPEALRGPQHSHARRTGAERILRQSGARNDRQPSSVVRRCDARRSTCNGCRRGLLSHRDRSVGRMGGKRRDARHPDRRRLAVYCRSPGD